MGQKKKSMRENYHRAPEKKAHIALMDKYQLYFT